MFHKENKDLGRWCGFLAAMTLLALCLIFLGSQAATAQGAPPKSQPSLENTTAAGRSLDQAIQPHATGFTVDLTQDRVWGLVSAGDRVTVTSSAGNTAYGSAEADGVGFFWTLLYDGSGNGQPVEIMGGDTITVFVNGAEVTTISPLTITGKVHVLTDSVTGTVETLGAGTDVTVTLGSWRSMVANVPQVTDAVDGNGNFEADFSAIADIGAAEMAQVEYRDGNDNTIQGYVYPSNVFRVVSYRSVEGYAEAGTYVTVTVYSTYSTDIHWRESAFAAPPHGSWNVYTDEGNIDYGDVVEVDLGGGTAISVTADPMGIMITNTATGEISGSVPANAYLRGYVWDGIDDLYAADWGQANASGQYSLTLGAEISPWRWVTVFYRDAEGDEVGYGTAPPHIRAYPQYNGVYAVADWPGQPVTYTIDTGSGVETVGGRMCVWDNSCEWAEFSEMEPGDRITAELPNMTMVMTVAELTAELDTADDQIEGTSDTPGRLEADTWQWYSDWYPINGDVIVSTTVSSPYVATFTNFDVRDGMWGWWVRLFDDDGGHQTYLRSWYGEESWAWETPFFEANIPDGVGGVSPEAHEAVTAELYAENGTTLLVSATYDYDDRPWRYWLGDFGEYRIEPGYWLTVTTESGWSGSLQIPTLTVQADDGTDLVTGEGPKALVIVEHGRDGDWADRFTPVDDYALDWSFFDRDLQENDQVGTVYQDISGNRVRAQYFWPILRIDANYGHDWVEGQTLPDVTVTITVADGGDIYTATTVADGGGWFGTHDWAGASWEPDQPNIQPGNVISASADGLTATIDPVGTITGELDMENDIVSGRIHASWFPTVAVQCELWTWGGPNIYLASVDAGGGEYVCDFGALNWEFEPGTSIAVWYVEPDGDRVGNVFEPPWMRVNYGHDWVGGTYPAGHTFWITVTDGGGTPKGYVEIDSEPGGGWGGDGFETRWEDWPAGRPPDIVADDLVYIRSDDGYNNTIEVGDIQGTVSMVTDSVKGPIYADWFMTDTVDVLCSIWGGVEGVPDIETTAGTDGDPPYFCQWTSYDIDRFYEVAVMYTEPDDGDRVINVFEDPNPNMQVEKWVEGGGEVAPDGPAVFTIRYRNHGPGAAEGVVLTDTLPGGATYVTDSSGFPVNVGTGVVTWNVGTVDPGDEILFQLVLTHTSSSSDTLHNEVDVYTPGDDDEGNDHAEADIHVAESDQEPDVYVDKGAEPRDPYPGDTMLWEIYYGNEGPVASGPVVMTDTLPENTQVVTWYSDNGYTLWIEESTVDEFILKAPSIPGNWGDRILLWLELDGDLEPGTQLTNTVEITTAGDSDDGDNKRTDDDVWVSGDKRWDVALYKSFGWGQLVPTGRVEYNLHIRNDGNRTTQVTVADTLPDGTSFDEAWAEVGRIRWPLPPDSEDGGKLIWDTSLGELMPGERMNLNVSLFLNDVEAGTMITNCAEISMARKDENPDNNEECVVDPISELGPNLRVYKEYRWEDVDRLRYDIYIENIGTHDLDGVILRELYPADTTLSEWYMGHGPEFMVKTHDAENHRLVLEAQDTMWAGSTARIEMYVDLDYPGVGGQELTNVAKVPLDGDVNSQDNTFEVTAYTGPDVFVEKWISGGEPRPGEIVTFTIEFGNMAPCPWDGDDQVGSHLTDTLPAEMTYVYATQPGDPNSEWQPNELPGNVLEWGWGTMWCDSRWKFELAVLIDEDVQGGDVLINKVKAYGDNPDDVEPDYANNTFKLPVTILGPALTVDKTYESSRVAGTTVTYTLEVTNDGDEKATGVVLQDTIPSNLTYGGGDGTKKGDTVTWNLSKVAPNGGTATGWFWGTLPCNKVKVTNDDYAVVDSDQGAISPPGDPVAFSVKAPTLSPSFKQSATQVDPGEKVKFTDTSTTDGSDIVAWGWDFGDGETGSGATISHAYDDAGTYSVTLTLTDSCGYSDSVSKPSAVTVSQTVSQIGLYLPLVLRGH